MVEIRALREAEPWSAFSILAAVLIALVMLAALGWLIYRYLRD